MFIAATLLTSGLLGFSSPQAFSNPCEVSMQQKGAKVVGFYDGQFAGRKSDILSLGKAPSRDYISSSGALYKVYFTPRSSWSNFWSREPSSLRDLVIVVEDESNIYHVSKGSVLASFKVDGRIDLSEAFDAVFERIDINEEVVKLAVAKGEMNHDVESLIKKRNSVALFRITADPDDGGYWGYKEV